MPYKEIFKFKVNLYIILGNNLHIFLVTILLLHIYTYLLSWGIYLCACVFWITFWSYWSLVKSVIVYIGSSTSVVKGVYYQVLSFEEDNLLTATVKLKKWTCNSMYDDIWMWICIIFQSVELKYGAGMSVNC